MTNIVFKMCSSGFAGAVEVLSRIFERVLALICFLTFTTHSFWAKNERKQKTPTGTYGRNE